MKYYCGCSERADFLIEGVLLCLSCFDEKYTENLADHARDCKCRACNGQAGEEYRKFQQLENGGHMERWMRPPRNPFVEREDPF